MHQCKESSRESLAMLLQNLGFRHSSKKAVTNIELFALTIGDFTEQWFSCVAGIGVHGQQCRILIIFITTIHSIFTHHHSLLVQCIVDCIIILLQITAGQLLGIDSCIQLCTQITGSRNEAFYKNKHCCNSGVPLQYSFHVYLCKMECSVSKWKFSIYCKNERRNEGRH